MKANGAPEKLYFTSTEDGTHYYTEGIPFEREYIEYTRTDAFIEKAIDAFRRTCPDSTELRKLDGTSEPFECFGTKCKEHSYRCNYICKRLRRFIDMLKEPEQ